MSGTLQVGGVTLGTHNSGTGKVDLTNAGTLSLGSAASNALTLGTSTTFPAGVMIKTTVYDVGKGTMTSGSFPADNTIPQRSEGGEFFSQAYTPSTANCTLLIRTFCYLAETSNVADDMGCALFISDDDDALQANASIWGTYGVSYGHDVGCRVIEHSMASWGETSKTFSLRAHKANAYNYPHVYGTNHSANYYGSAATSKFIIQEVAT